MKNFEKIGIQLTPPKTNNISPKILRSARKLQSLTYRRKTPSVSYDTPSSLRTIADENLQHSKVQASSIAERLQIVPDLKKPLRIELPSYFNTPCRIELIQTTIKIDSEERTRILKRLKDYQMLALACRRAKKEKDEGRAYYSIGVLLDNLSLYRKAIEYYEKFLAICIKVKDSHGEALAYNCLGVDHQLLGEGIAQEYHERHRSISDVHGKFIAHMNLGLFFSTKQDFLNSNLNYQLALKFATLLSSPIGQSLALGNMTELCTGPHGKIQDIADQYLKICVDLNNRKAEGIAEMQIGKACAAEHNYAKGSAHFARVLRATKGTRDEETSD